MTLLDRLDGLHSAQDLRPAALATPAVTEEAADLREAFEERAGILEYDAAIPRSEAELEAARSTVPLARNRGTPGHPYGRRSRDTQPCSLRLPDTPGAVDALPLGTAKLAVLKGRRVVWQGSSAERRRRRPCK